MRRPTLCCDNQATADVDSPCKDQGGAFARMRRLFLSKPLARRSSLASGSSKSPCRAAGTAAPRCSASSSNRTSGSAPPLQLQQSFVCIQQEVLGAELETVVMTSKNHQGVPALVYQLCSYILNHEVDSSALVFEKWSSSDVRDVLARHPRCCSLEASNVAPLLRLFVELLPHPLIPRATSAALVTIASDAASTQGRQLLLAEVPAPHLRLLRYLTAFLSCLSHANRCDGGEAWVLLAAGVAGPGERRLLSKAVAQYLLLHNLSLFPEERLSLPPTPASDDIANSSDTSLTVLTSQEEEELDSSGGGIASSTTNDDEDDRMSSSSSSTSSRSCTTTSEDTEGFRSPKLAMGEVPGRYRTMEETLSPDIDQLEQLSTGPEVSSDYPEADELTTTESGESQEPQKQNDTVTASDSLPSASDSANTDEPDDERKGTSVTGDHPLTGRSTNSSEHALLPLPFTCDTSALPDIWDRALVARPLHESASEAGVEESDSSALNNPSDQWNDFSSAGEVYLGGVSSEDAPVQDEPWLGAAHTEGSQRWSERLYAARPAATEYQSPERHHHHHHHHHRHHHKSKRRKSKSRRHSKDAGAAYASSESSVTEKLQSASQPLSEGEEGDDNCTPSSPTTDNEGPLREDSLSSLLDHSEPAITSDRGRWQAPQVDDHRTAFRYSPRYAEDDDVVTSCPWYKYDRPVVKDALPSTVAGSNTSFSTAFIQAVAGKYSSGTPSHRNVSAIKKRIKRFEEDFENKFGYKPSHSEKMKHKEIKKYMSDLSKARKELKTMKEGVADLVSSKGFSLSLLRCQESTAPSHTASPDAADAPSAGPDHASTLQKVEERLRESRMSDDRPVELSKMSVTQMQEEKTCLQKALLYYESVHGRPNTRDTRELARPLYDRYRQVKRNVSRAQIRAKENMNELAPIIEHVAMDFTLASPQHRSSLTPEAQPTEQLLLCKERLLDEQRRQCDMLRSPDSDEEDDEQQGQEASLSDSSDVSKQSSTLGNLHSLPLHELKERRREAKDQKKKLRKSLRLFEERYEREHGHKLAKENRGAMEQTYLDYKHAKAKLRLLEALISKKAPKEDEF